MVKPLLKGFALGLLLHQLGKWAKTDKLHGLLGPAVGAVRDYLAKNKAKKKEEDEWTQGC